MELAGKARFYTGLGITASQPRLSVPIPFACFFARNHLFLWSGAISETGEWPPGGTLHCP